jgi:hypothetical protein
MALDSPKGAAQGQPRRARVQLVPTLEATAGLDDDVKQIGHDSFFRPWHSDLSWRPLPRRCAGLRCSTSLRRSRPGRNPQNYLSARRSERLSPPMTGKHGHAGPAESRGRA